MRRYNLHTAFVLIVLMGLTLITVQFSVRALATPPPAASSQSHILVHIIELTGTGSDGRTYTLYRDEQGYTTTLNALGRVGSQVNGNTLPDGAYHTLFVRLRDDYQLVGNDGTQRSGKLSEQGKPTTIRIRGMLMVENGRATPLRMLENPNHYRNPAGLHGGEDDDD